MPTRAENSSTFFFLILPSWIQSFKFSLPVQEAPVEQRHGDHAVQFKALQ